MDVNHRLKFEIDKTILTCNKSERMKELSITYERTDGPTLIVKKLRFQKERGDNIYVYSLHPYIKLFSDD